MKPLLAEPDHCTGCSVCAAVCPSGAISMEPDSEGFQYPVVHEEKCSACGKCSAVCPTLSCPELDRYENVENVYACWTKNEEVRKCSSSGGAFMLLAERIIDEGGVIFGAAMIDKTVRHMKAETKEELLQLQGSKYVQSDVFGIYSQVETDLLKNKKVLYSGTPCQISGLYAFLGKDYERLYTCDVVCHGTPSPLMWREYVAMQEGHYNSPMILSSFRSKKIGWNCFCMEESFANGAHYCKSTYYDPFIRGFLRNLYLRPSCYSCQYANIRRTGDITLADFWGCANYDKEGKDDDKGISMVMINSRKGNALFEHMKEISCCFQHDISEMSGNQPLSKPFPVPQNRTAFWRDYHNHGFEYVAKQYLFPEKRARLKMLRWTWCGKLLHSVKCLIKKQYLHYARSGTNERIL